MLMKALISSYKSLIIIKLTLMQLHHSLHEAERSFVQTILWAVLEDLLHRLEIEVVRRIDRDRHAKYVMGDREASSQD